MSDWMIEATIIGLVETIQEQQAELQALREQAEGWEAAYRKEYDQCMDACERWEAYNMTDPDDIKAALQEDKT